VSYSRQSSQSLRQNMETIIEHFLDRPNIGFKRTQLLPLPWLSSANLSTVSDLIGPPDLNQARVNKCLVALVNRKMVYKENSTVSVGLL
jgi:DASH complex subunit DAM1